MAPPTKKQLNRGFYGYQSDDAEFLKPERASPWVDDYSGASKQGYNARWNDNAGPFEGSNWSDCEAHGLVSKRADESQAGIRDIGSLIDNQEDWGSGNKLMGGGGPVSDNERNPRDSSWRGSDRKGPRYSNPLGRSGQGNMKGHK